MKLKYILCCSIMTIFCGCAFNNSSNIANNKPINYICDDGGYSFTFQQISEDAVKITDNSGKKIELTEVPSASGAKYKNSEYELFTKGDDAMLIYTDKSNGKVYTKEGCKVEK